MTALDLVIRARRLVSTAGVLPAAVGVRDGRIVAIEPDDSAPESARSSN